MKENPGDIARKCKRERAIDDAIFITFGVGALLTSAAVLDFCRRLIVVSWRFDNMLGACVTGFVMMATAWAIWDLKARLRKHLNESGK